MKNLTYCFLIFLIIGSFSHCKKDSIEEKLLTLDNDKVCIYFADYNQENKNYTPTDKIVGFDEIIGYDPETHILLINDIAKEKIKNYGNGYFAYPVTGVPFVLRVNGETIFGGFFVTGFSSLIFIDRICIDPLGGNRLRLDLGYPGTFDFTGIDRRNDPRFIKILNDYNKIMTLSD